jgi:predicted phage tail protein
MTDAKYCYRVQAVNSVTNSEWSDVKCITVVNPTNTPTPSKTHTPTTTPALSIPELEAIENPDKDGNYTVVWSAVENAEAYRLKEKLDGRDQDRVDQIAAPDTQLEFNDQEPGKYCYTVRAIIIDGYWSPFSAEACTTVNSPTATPAATSMLTATATATATATSTPTPTDMPAPTDIP